MEQRIKTRLEELVKERERYIQQANQQIAAYDAIINELGKLLGTKEEKPISS